MGQWKSKLERFLMNDYFPSEEELLTWLKDEQTGLLAAYGYRVLVVASRRGFSEVVKLLLVDGRVDPSSRGNCAICRASQNGHSAVVKLLLDDERVDPAADDNRAIRRASENGYPKVVQLLLASHRLYPLRLEKLTSVRETVVTYLFQRYSQLLLLGIENDIIQTIIGLVVT